MTAVSAKGMPQTAYLDECTGCIALLASAMARRYKLNTYQFLNMRAFRASPGTGDRRSPAPVAFFRANSAFWGPKSSQTMKSGPETWSQGWLCQIWSSSERRFHHGRGIILTWSRRSLLYSLTCAAQLPVPRARPSAANATFCSARPSAKQSHRAHKPKKKICLTRASAARTNARNQNSALARAKTKKKIATQGASRSVTPARYRAKAKKKKDRVACAAPVVRTANAKKLKKKIS